MNIFKKLSLVSLLFVAVFWFVTPIFAAPPDGPGPWADTVFSVSQGLMKNGSPVPLVRSNPSSALGVAENNTTEGNFFSLGFGGNIVLGFDNGISNGAIVVEATIPGYPGEMANIEMSEDGTTWFGAGTLTQDGTVNIPEQLNCARYVRLTDISDPNIFLEGTADGFDVDGVSAVGQQCSPPSPVPSPQPSPSPSAPPPPAPTPSPTAPPACTSPGVSSIPVILATSRLSPTSIFLSWGPDAGYDDFVIRYGFVDGEWLFNTSVSGFSMTINDLPANQPIFIQVAATDGCATGAFSASVLAGGAPPATGVPGFPETGGTGGLSPRLPNTGFGPNGVSWTIPVSILAGTLTLYLAWRAYKFSSSR